MEKKFMKTVGKAGDDGMDFFRVEMRANAPEGIGRAPG